MRKRTESECVCVCVCCGCTFPSSSGGRAVMWWGGLMSGECEPTTPRDFLTMNTLPSGLSYFPIHTLCLSFFLSFLSLILSPCSSPIWPPCKCFYYPVSPLIRIIIFICLSVFVFFPMFLIVHSIQIRTSLGSRIWDLRVCHVNLVCCAL